MWSLFCSGTVNYESLQLANTNLPMRTENKNRKSERSRAYCYEVWSEFNGQYQVALNILNSDTCFHDFQWKSSAPKEIPSGPLFWCYRRGHELARKKKKWCRTGIFFRRQTDARISILGCSVFRVYFLKRYSIQTKNQRLPAAKPRDLCHDMNYHYRYCNVFCRHKKGVQKVGCWWTKRNEINKYFFNIITMKERKKIDTSNSWTLPLNPKKKEGGDPSGFVNAGKCISKTLL